MAIFKQPRHNHRGRQSGKGRQQERGREKGERWAIIASLSNLGDISPRFLSPPVSVCVRQLPEQPNAMATALRRPVRGCFEKRRRETERRRRRDERRGFPFSFPGRHVVQLLSRHEDTPHTSLLLASIHAQEIASLPPSLTLHRLHVNFSPWLPLANTVINLSFSLPLWQNQWTVLGAGVDTTAQCTGLGTPDCYISPTLQARWCFLSILFVKNPCGFLMREPIHGNQ